MNTLLGSYSFRDLGEYRVYFDTKPDICLRVVGKSNSLPIRYTLERLECCLEHAEGETERVFELFTSLYRSALARYIRGEDL